MKKMKVLIVDDEKLIREGLKIILSSYEDLDIVGLCENGQTAYAFCEKQEVDIVLMDIRMAICDGVLATKLIKEKYPHIKVLMLTTFKDTQYLQEALHNGASGYLLKDSSYDLLYGGIKAAYEGNIVVHPEVAAGLMEGTGSSLEKDVHKLKETTLLTDKELSIITEIANGLTNKEIGEKLYLTEGTIKNNITGILSKLALRDRTQIAIFAFKNHLMDE